MASEVVNAPGLTLNRNALAQTTMRRITRRHRAFGKRAIDILVALTAILLLSPLLVCIALMIRKGGTAAIYSHRRVGRRGQPFPCYKFQSMVANADVILSEHLAANPAAAEEWRLKRKLKVDPRVTRFGRVLRESSVDELPQLFNILRGDMSFVGPRPIMFEELAQYGHSVRDYFAVRPGLTGLWQVSGRNTLDFSERVEFDQHYVRNQTLFYDLTIILRTVPEVMWRRRTS